MKLAIIGNGVAGTTTARYVADRDRSIEIEIYSEEPYRYYPRPRLIDLLAAKVSKEDIVFYPEAWYAEREIQTFLGRRVVAIHPRAHEIQLEQGGSVTYDQLVLATGARAVVPPIPGIDLDGVYTFRTMRDALTLRDRAEKIEHAVILGGGLLGLDTSRALCAHGIGVTVVELLPWLLPMQLDREGADLLQRFLEDAGAEIVTGDPCASIEGNGKVDRIRLRSGTVIETDMLIMSVGVRPNRQLAERAGLAHNRGVVVDERLRTSDEDVYAVGDVAEFRGKVWGIIPVALAQARVAAAQITGDSEVHYRAIVPSTTLRVAGIVLTSLGEVTPEGGQFAEVRHLDSDARVYKKLVIRDGRIVGAIVLGDRTSVPAIQRLMTRQVNVSAHVDSLLREDFDLASLL
jgi:NAD(P)H-nitrite reductase large subunit